MRNFLENQKSKGTINSSILTKIFEALEDLITPGSQFYSLMKWIIDNLKCLVYYSPFNHDKNIDKDTVLNFQNEEFAEKIKIESEGEEPYLIMFDKLLSEYRLLSGCKDNLVNKKLDFGGNMNQNN